MKERGGDIFVEVFSRSVFAKVIDCDVIVGDDDGSHNATFALTAVPYLQQKTNKQKSAAAAAYQTSSLGSYAHDDITINV